MHGRLSCYGITHYEGRYRPGRFYEQITDDWEEAKELLREADEELLLGVYRLLSPEMKRFIQLMTRNALYAEREKEKKEKSHG